MTTERKRTRRPSGEGSVYQATDKGVLVWRYAYFEDGKRHYRRARPNNEVAAWQQLRQALRRIAEARPSVDDNRTVKAYLGEWFEDRKGDLRPETIRRYSIVIDKHIVPAIGHVRLSGLKPEHIHALYRSLAKKPATARSVHNLLRTALTRAERWSLIPRNPVDQVDPPKGAKSKRRALTFEQAKALVEAARGDRLEAMYVLTLCTGLRLGEVTGLRWQDIDLERGRLTVAYQLRWEGKEAVLTRPKTEAGLRTIALPRVAVEALLDHRARQLVEAEDWEGEETGLVFTDSRGNPLRPANFYKRDWAAVLNRASLQGKVFHELRHTTASLLGMAGIPMKEVQAVLGHATMAITSDLYSHVYEEQSERAAQAIDGLLLPAPSSNV